ncbi:MAG: hypothetical protein RLZZ455_149 [Candidatus Parcubacteria bacterium]|jgi:predicted ribosomally synthesized peptide with SipW-like signal peptide
MLPALHQNILTDILRNKRFTALAAIYFVGISLVFTQITHALFTDSASSNNNTFTAASVFPTGVPLTSAQLKINEVSSAGSALVEWIEIFNPTASSVDISGWSVLDNTSSDIIPSVSPIPPGGYAVIIPTGSSTLIPGSATAVTLGAPTIGNGLADTGDRVILKDASSTEIDNINYGTDTTIFPTPPAAPSTGVTLSRNPNGTDTDTAADWILDNSPSIGISN